MRSGSLLTVIPAFPVGPSASGERAGLRSVAVGIEDYCFDDQMMSGSGIIVLAMVK